MQPCSSPDRLSARWELRTLTLNPKTARSQIIGGMTMGAGAALMEEMGVDKKAGFFVNHDLAGYKVPVQKDIPHQEVVFL
jgi:xanthine dehydrogenase YagR molybdenum-binding subunit